MMHLVNFLYQLALADGEHQYSHGEILKITYFVIFN
jgi:hypothetical protein